MPPRTQLLLKLKKPSRTHREGFDNLHSRRLSPAGSKQPTLFSFTVNPKIIWGIIRLTYRPENRGQYSSASIVSGEKGVRQGYYRLLNSRIDPQML